MKNLKKKEGITLVALIITIVVLLILAAVAIGAAKDSSIIGYAQNAGVSYEEARDNELTEISKYENLIETYQTKETSDAYTFTIEEIMQRGNAFTDFARIIKVDEFWPENVSEELKNMAFDTEAYLDEIKTRFASNFTCSDSRFINPFAEGGSQYWNEDTCCYILQEEIEGEKCIILCVQLEGMNINDRNYKEKGLENLKFTISIPGK